VKKMTGSANLSAYAESFEREMASWVASGTSCFNMQFNMCSWLRHYATSWKVQMTPSSLIMALGSTQPVRDMSARNLPGGKERPARKADNFTAICEPIL
jgi:hypothetical protein